MPKTMGGKKSVWNVKKVFPMKPEKSGVTLSRVRGLSLNEKLIKIQNIMENTHRDAFVTSFTLVSRVNDFPLTWTGPFHLFMVSLISFSS